MSVLFFLFREPTNPNQTVGSIFIGRFSTRGIGRFDPPGGRSALSLTKRLSADLIC
jgi:hypothetical protein